MRTPTWNQERFATVLGEISKRANLSQAELAELAGRSRSQINRWTRSENQPTYDSVAKLAAGISAKYSFDDLAEHLMEAAGYEPLRRRERAEDVTGGVTEGRQEPMRAAREVLANLRGRAQAESRPLAEVLVEEGLVEVEELVVPASLQPDRFIEEINASDIAEETKIAVIRMHLENRARRFEEARLEQKRLDG